MNLEETILHNQQLEGEEVLIKLKDMYRDGLEVVFGYMRRIDFRDKYELNNSETIDYIVELRRDLKEMNTHITYVNSPNFNYRGTQQ